MTTQTPVHKTIPWTKKDAKIVTDYYPDGGSTEVNAALAEAGRPQRSPSSIWSFAHDIGLRRNKRGDLIKKKVTPCLTSSAT